MVYHSSQSAQNYLQAMKQQMSGHFEFGQERFTGFLLGKFFYVTHHAGFEWNRKITNQKNAAMGFVQQEETGCSVHFVRFRGLLCPLHFLSTFLTVLPLSIILALSKGNGLSLDAMFYICVAVMVVFAPVHTLIECCTKKSDIGRRTLLSLLKNPADPYEQYKYIP